MINMTGLLSGRHTCQATRPSYSHFHASLCKVAKAVRKRTWELEPFRRSAFLHCAGYWKAPSQMPLCALRAESSVPTYVFEYSLCLWGKNGDGEKLQGNIMLWDKLSLRWLFVWLHAHQWCLCLLICPENWALQSHDSYSEGATKQAKWLSSKLFQCGLLKQQPAAEYAMEITCKQLLAHYLRASRSGLLERAHLGYRRQSCAGTGPAAWARRWWAARVPRWQIKLYLIHCTGPQT